MKLGSKDHIKVKRLKRALGIPLYQALGLLETLCQVTAQSADDGGIGRYTDSDIAIELEWEGDPSVLIAALRDCGWLDECSVNRLCIHDWMDHAPDFIKDRLRKRNEKTYANKTMAVSDSSRNDGGDSDSSRNSPGDSDSTNSIQANSSQFNSSSRSASRRKRVGALTSLDLKDPGRVLGWLEARHRGNVSDEQRIVALAASRAALRSGKDPPALFVSIVSEGKRASVQNDDMDWASQVLKDYMAVAAVTDQLRRKD